MSASFTLNDRTTVISIGMSNKLTNKTNPGTLNDQGVK